MGKRVSRACLKGSKTAMRIDGGASQWTEVGFRCPRCHYQKNKEHWYSLRVPTIHSSWDEWMDIEKFYKDWNRLISTGVIVSKSPSEAYLRFKHRQTEPMFSVSLIETSTKRVLLGGFDYLKTLKETPLSGLCPCPKCDYLNGEFTLSLVIC